MHCPNCGNELNENQKFCSKCGAKISNAKSQTETDEITKKYNTLNKKQIFITLFTIFIFCVIAILCFAYQNYKNNVQETNSGRINCQNYQDFSIDDEKSASGYIQCTLDEKIAQLNDRYEFEEQSEYWDNIYTIIEHSFENKIKYQNIQPTLIGKYNTMDKIYLAVYKEWTLYNLGKIALGLEEAVGPNSMYGNGTWKEYLEVTKSSNHDFAKLSSEEQIALAKKIQKQNTYLSDKFKNDYFKKVYVTELMGIKNNATNEKTQELLQEILSEYEKVVNENSKLKPLENNETWKKLKEHIYFDTQSLKITDSGRIGDFKIYRGAEDVNFLFDSYENCAYIICKVKIDNSGNIIFPGYEYFDEDGNLIFADYPRAFDEEKYSEYKNGQIYYNALYNN